MKNIDLRREKRYYRDMLKKGKKPFFLSLFLLAAFFCYGQGRGAIFDEQYENLPRRAELTERSYEGLPASFSLKQYAPLPGDQAEFGTCVAWAAAYSARTISESIALNRLNQSETTQNAFSPTHIYRNIRPDDPGGLRGAQIYMALDYMRDTGAVKMIDIERLLTFTRIDLSHFKAARNYPIAGYVTLFSREDRQKPALITRIVKKSLTEGKPVIIGMNTPDSFNDAKDVWRPTESRERFYYGHALCVIGYDDNRYGGAFEVLNSWGRKWGNGGFLWIPYNVFVDFVMEAYELIDNIANYSDAVKFDGFMQIQVSDNQSARTVNFSLANNDYYSSNETFSEGTKMSFSVGSRESAYVYSFMVSQPEGHDNYYSPVLLFPSSGVFPLLNYNDSVIELPGAGKSITLNTSGKCYLITLYSKQALNIQNIINAFISSKGSLNKRLSAAIGDGYTTSASYSETEPSFTASPVNSRAVIVLIAAIEIKEP